MKSKITQYYTFSFLVKILGPDFLTKEKEALSAVGVKFVQLIISLHNLLIYKDP